MRGRRFVNPSPRRYAPPRCCSACSHGSPLVAAALYAAQPAPAPRHAVWYAKTLPTFVDALAQVRQTLWTAYPTFQTSLPNAETVKISKPLFDTLISTRCYAA